MYAYILVGFKPGKEREAFDELSHLEKIVDINLIFGEWDIIMKVEIESPGDLEQFIIEQVRVLDGVNLTSTMIVAR